MFKYINSQFVEFLAMEQCDHLANCLPIYLAHCQAIYNYVFEIQLCLHTHTQARSQDFQKGGYMDVCMPVWMRNFISMQNCWGGGGGGGGRVWGHATPENFLKF